MTDLLWTRPISWTMWRRLADCGRQAEYQIAERMDEPRAARETGTPTFWADTGTVVQKIFELYFNQGVNRRPGGDTQATIQVVCQKVMAGTFVQELLEKTTYPDGKTREDLVASVQIQSIKGLEACRAAGILRRAVQSEVPLHGTLRGMSSFGYLDFRVPVEGGVMIFDGKSNSQKNADPRQLLFYAAVESFKTGGGGETVKGGGFLYWKHGFVPVDMSAEKIHAFMETPDFMRVQGLVEKLRTVGIPALPAGPEFSRCKWCDWNLSCPDALGREKRAIRYDLPEEIGFDDI